MNEKQKKLIMAPVILGYSLALIIDIYLLFRSPQDGKDIGWLNIFVLPVLISINIVLAYLVSIVLSFITSRFFHKTYSTVTLRYVGLLISSPLFIALAIGYGTSSL